MYESTRNMLTCLEWRKIFFEINEQYLEYFLLVVIIWINKQILVTRYVSIYTLVCTYMGSCVYTNNFLIKQSLVAFSTDFGFWVHINKCYTQREKSIRSWVRIFTPTRIDASSSKMTFINSYMKATNPKCGQFELRLLTRCYKINLFWYKWMQFLIFWRNF